MSIHIDISLSERQTKVVRKMLEDTIEANRSQLLHLLGPDHPDDKELKASVQRISVAEILLNAMAADK